MEKLSLWNKFGKILKPLFLDAFRASLDLFRITIPIGVLTKILHDAGATVFIGELLNPVMEMVGLPGSMGLVWAGAMLTNLYGGMVVFASVAPQTVLSVAQVTVLTTMMLVAHSLPVELKIAQKAGSKLWITTMLRLAGALLLGWILSAVYSAFNWLQEPNRALWTPSQPDSSWSGWVKGELRNSLYIFLMIFFLMAIMRILQRAGVLDMINRRLEPLLKLLGMSPKAAPITVIGMTLGLSYGGALIIQEARSGRLCNKDIFLSLALMGICHSIVEDTLLMMVLGGHLSGLLLSRVVFSLLLIYLLGRIVHSVSDEKFCRYLFRKQGDASSGLR